ncbi:MAG TPA: DEAD/DEAH box helicase [Firmicutes bacterium]|nr:DEAD/DEAH box helicase [Bacillota bacterium]
MERPVLELFHPLVQKWFTGKLGEPTDIQKQAWPQIAQGKHVLLVAPTGSGKTLTAFLWALQKLITGEWETGQVRVLYVSPLKALNNDVRRNLLQPLRELQAYFTAAGHQFPALSVLTRSGDTPQHDRRKMLRRPPEILITTPESLNLILTAKNSRTMLKGIKTVILDEIHAALGSKRGTHLITAVDRLVPLAGEFQRIALSATVNPADVVAAFAGGFTARREGESWHYQQREMIICRSQARKQYQLQVRTVPPRDNARETEDTRWLALAAALAEKIRTNKATLVFCNNRRLVEKMTRFINDCAGEPLVYSHHGSLAKELRLAVEEKLKRGELKGIVATNSLELGIDIGALDEVLLVQTPPSLTSAVQRIGRAGHGVGQVSRGTLYPVSGRDFLEAAVTSMSLPAAEIEPVSPVDAPLDVLTQVLLSMTAAETWDVDELYAFLKTSYPYRNLSRRSYDLLLEMLAGRYADTRLRELKPRIMLDKLDNTVKARDGAASLIYQGGGTIPDRGYYDLRLADTKAKIGELDEEFVWERSLGDTFMLGTKVWRIVRVTHNDVEVVPGESTINIIPFWRAEEQYRDFFYAEKIGLFLEEADKNLDDGLFARTLVTDYHWSEDACRQLLHFLRRQKEATGKPLPHRHHLLVEHLADPKNSPDGKRIIIHTLWGGKVNRPFSQALAAALEEKYGFLPEAYTNNDSIMLVMPANLAPQKLFGLVTPENVEKLLRQRLESSGFFGARFRENAGRALLLPKAGFKKRMPLWLNRLRAKKLLSAVAQYEDFPIMLETWRSCLADEFDLERLKQLLEEINSGQILVSETHTSEPSPFCADLIWRQVNKYMYEDDTPFAEKPSALNEELIKELLSSPQLRPEIPESLVGELDGKLKRTAAGYAPGDAEELLLWLKERLFIPRSEAEALFAAMERDYGLQQEEILAGLGGKAAWVRLPRAEETGLCPLEVLPRICRALGTDLLSLNPAPLQVQAEQELAAGLQKVQGMLRQETTEAKQWQSDTALFVSQWLSSYGPVAADFVPAKLGLTQSAWAGVLAALLAEDSIVTDVQVQAEKEAAICDRENLERLLAMVRRARRPQLAPLPAGKLPLFLASHQGVAEKGTTLEDLQLRLDQLFGYVTYAHLWEEAILPARMETYFSAWMDSLLQTSGLIWFGRGRQRIGFCFQDDLELFPVPEDAEGEKNAVEAQALFPDPRGRYDFLALSRNLPLATDELAQKLWQYVWQGQIANDSFAVLRSGLLNKFRPAPLETGRRSFGRRGGFNRWAATRPLQGSWFLLPQEGERDLIGQEELVKDRIRQLLLRYGILFRELLQQELPQLQWRSIFRTLRLLEFSGEVYAGHFFQGLPGLQFAGPEAYRRLQAALDEDSIYWLNAADPASPCGLKIPGLDEDLPPRVPTNYLVFHGSRLKVVARRNGKALVIKTEPDDPALPDYLAFFRTLLTRDFSPVRSIRVETINGQPALSSPYKKALQQMGFTGQYKFLELRRAYW